MGRVSLCFPQLSLHGFSCIDFQVADLTEMLFNILNKWVLAEKTPHRHRQLSKRQNAPNVTVVLRRLITKSGAQSYLIRRAVRI
jgi:hypothetical protein